VLGASIAMHEGYLTTEQLWAYVTGHGDAPVIEEHLAVCAAWNPLLETDY
jgi:hypothetical protein